MASCSKPSEWREIIRNEALRIGFDACGFARVEAVDADMRDSYRQWLASGKQAQMGYLDNYVELRDNPALLYPGARTMICVALNYYPVRFQSGESPRFAYYAYGRDYHDVMRDKLRQLAVFVSSYSGDTGRVCCDTAPVRERYWAVRAGLGFIGKNAQLIIPGKGSFFFLGEIVTTLEADQYDTPQKNRCGSCSRCLDACPTGALEGPRHLNARKCLSYLTIENRGEIPTEQASRLGNRLYGCDTCQEVCPWNRFARPTQIEAFRPKPALLSLRKEDLKVFSREDYNRIFAKSAVKRAKYEGLIRNIHNLKD